MVWCTRGTDVINGRPWAKAPFTVAAEKYEIHWDIRSEGKYLEFISENLTIAFSNIIIMLFIAVVQGCFDKFFLKKGLNLF